MRLILFTLFLFPLLFSCKTPDARRPVSTLSGSFIDESIVRNKKLAAREEAQIQKIIAEDTINNYIASKGGFWYYYKKQDTLQVETPQFGDVVNFNYNVKDLNGNFIYTKKELDTINYVIDKEELFLGLREGLKLMKPGEVVTFLFPSYQAYGYYGDDNKIGTNIPLISEVTLHKITKQTTIEN
ncbi:gliding motility-associated peptidyl-prolyl isomerase GldI [Aquimarina sp. 2201CG5-10]|uniref:gliding motility-associated peptidyl-prolyl isomerase GldI n=1 Tax=Aquimarina callyspongiae TaxID=3098150 RepID=UPI002AB3B5DF|nr:gliding motility-associated peptidyl-prolyl isomerase GldI [Aquimarina sp. 2201CG5-10]MDY8137674.1 gliding motility-associated peptidyl-prolyl isomerase GldI [Aquimarina sp. 2201CG5-10]